MKWLVCWRRDLMAAGFETIGDLLHFFPRDHISYGAPLFPFLSQYHRPGIDYTILRCLLMDPLHGGWTSIALQYNHQSCQCVLNAAGDSLVSLQLCFHCPAGPVLRHDTYVHMEGTVLSCTCRMARNILILEIEALVPAPPALEGKLLCLCERIACSAASLAQTMHAWLKTVALCVVGLPCKRRRLCWTLQLVDTR